MIHPQYNLTDTTSFLQSEHFRINYALRNPREGQGRGTSGVSGTGGLIEAYMKGLEMLYSELTSSPMSRPESDRITEVYVLDVASIFPMMSASFTSEDQDGVPYIVLPCRTSDPTCEAERQRALATAVHEATHVFNYRKRPLSSPYSARWGWFDEALAVFMEMRLITDYRDHFRFLGNWIEKPELSLDAPAANYQAGQFLAYLAKRLGIEFVNRVWMESEERETPIETITRLLSGGLKLASADPVESDLFASYCLESWFLTDPAGLMYAPDLYERYGERAITESFALRSGESVGTSEDPKEQDALDHLACRYYRFYLNDGIKKVNVELQSSDEAESFPLKAELAIVSRDNQLGQVIPLRSTPNNRNILAAHVNHDDPFKDDHFILVVTNCGLSQRFDDEKRFTIKALAI
jgi:hypothetical protein